jgi:hypothetical protein
MLDDDPKPSDRTYARFLPSGETTGEVSFQTGVTVKRRSSEPSSVIANRSPSREKTIAGSPLSSNVLALDAAGAISTAERASSPSLRISLRILLVRTEGVQGRE